ncbi:MAG: hypothetical protein LCH85_23255 [Chloroflexi bacterium]|nr:hypothetical protein [Chloroflexota bacterium]
MIINLELALLVSGGIVLEVPLPPPQAAWNFDALLDYHGDGRFLCWWWHTQYNHLIALANDGWLRAEAGLWHMNFVQDLRDACLLNPQLAFGNVFGEQPTHALLYDREQHCLLAVALSAVLELLDHSIHELEPQLIKQTDLKRILLALTATPDLLSYAVNQLHIYEAKTGAGAFNLLCEPCNDWRMCQFSAWLNAAIRNQIGSN